LEIADRTVFISPVGCSVFGYYYFNCGNVQAAHGRAPAVATGVTRSNPDNIVISYQGDGDLAAIGTAEIIHAANRGEKMTVFFVNNAIYGMTGGQMAPTSLINQKTMTSPYGRSETNEGFPIKIAEMIAGLESPVYVTRTSVHNIKNIMKTRSAVRKALQYQIDGHGFSFVEIVSTCPSAWKIEPVENEAWVEEHMLPYYDLKVFKDKKVEADDDQVDAKIADIRELFELDVPEPELEDGVQGFKTLKLISAGFGGQGVLKLGALLAATGMSLGYKTTWLPSYGPEMRGGTANCSVVIDANEIGTPVVDSPDLIICMNSPSLTKFVPMVKEGGNVLYNASISNVDSQRAGVNYYPIMASDLAKEAGTEKAANMVMIGAISAIYRTISKEAVFNMIEEQFPNEKVQIINKKAFEAGFSSVKD